MNIDIDVDEVYHAMYQRDKKEMAELLAEDGYCMTWEEVDQANSKAGSALSPKNKQSWIDLTDFFNDMQIITSNNIY
jgi:hypothetical protein